MGLENAKVGDKLIVSSRWNTNIHKVVRVTKTMVITNPTGSYEYRFRISNGNMVGGDSWTTTRARIATEDDMKKIIANNKKNRLARECSEIKFHDLTMEQLEQILKIANNGTETD